ncbi:helix-turn-helix domain-containing protein [Leptobacterium flavescens]|uniref:Helix-turn-helix domain-containing protein n=1 Tax=Leptobacterium flavescens TaxID=472055 RepID=A0A6P0UU09_9FLAO|nr:Crp/Fnr family transcriptional regulator [Leptobacterium flavescens]NER15508.1 helix-turn-helix domain-containing protein [Leptobacterium flavescens]
MDNDNSKYIKRCLPFLEAPLYEEIKETGFYKEFPKGVHVVKQGAYLNFLPLVLDGIIKMYAEEDSVQFLLYYINPGETCVMSFNHLFGEEAVQFSAITEEETTVLCLPVQKVKEWFVKYPSFSRVIIKDYQKNFEDLLKTTKDIICYKMEDRLIKYLENKSKILKSQNIHLSHQNIASDLGTSREVISRITKKLEHENLLIQHKRHIELLLN